MLYLVIKGSIPTVAGYEREKAALRPASWSFTYSGIDSKNQGSRKKKKKELQAAVRATKDVKSRVGGCEVWEASLST